MFQNATTETWTVFFSTGVILFFTWFFVPITYDVWLWHYLHAELTKLLLLQR